VQGVTLSFADCSDHTGELDALIGFAAAKRNIFISFIILLWHVAYSGFGRCQLAKHNANIVKTFELYRIMFPDILQMHEPQVRPVRRGLPV